MSQQQRGHGPLSSRQPGRTLPAPHEESADSPPPARFVGWLGGLGAVAAGYGVFQFLFSVLPGSFEGSAARYVIAGVSGLGICIAAWLVAALLRARAAATERASATRVGPAATAPGAPDSLPQAIASAYDTLLDQVSVVDDPEHGRLTGWPHSLGEDSPSRPTPVGTAYGLHIMLDLGVPDGRLSTGDLVDTLWRMRLPDGGWSARSQGSEARPEVTALVLGALARAGASGERLAAEVDRCASGFTRQLDRAGWESTHVVTTVLRGLLRAAPRSESLPVLRQALADGAISDPHRDHLRCWGYRLQPPYGPPSPLHTAQAIVALDRAARVLGEGGDTRAAREDGIRWLLSCPDAPHDTCLDLENLYEEVRRPRTDDPSRHEVLNVRHFTASWLARALLSPGALEIARAEGLQDELRVRLEGAVAAVWAGQTDGIWYWGRGAGTEVRRPISMTYQGLSALRTHAVWLYQPAGRTHM
ncbi:terpene cyclase/mutase family protein [Streptomyces sp. PSKA01]|uniref:Terpene cyclase/mutase family protein n=1 Tax=Streptomyces cupreus TaxID=2759956 RepID=A0A7X1J588_9ACTN|nr:terpene cyclase/mutase family protein [Streptomyces cupreus]